MLTGGLVEALVAVSLTPGVSAAGDRLPTVLPPSGYEARARNDTLAVVSTVFVFAVVWVLESKEPESHKDFLLAVKAKGSGPRAESRSCSAATASSSSCARRRRTT